MCLLTNCLSFLFMQTVCGIKWMKLKLTSAGANREPCLFPAPPRRGRCRCSLLAGSTSLIKILQSVVMECSRVLRLHVSRSSSVRATRPPPCSLSAAPSWHRQGRGATWCETVTSGSRSANRGDISSWDQGATRGRADWSGTRAERSLQ